MTWLSLNITKTEQYNWCRLINIIERRSYKMSNQSERNLTRIHYKETWQSLREFVRNLLAFSSGHPKSQRTNFFRWKMLHFNWLKWKKVPFLVTWMSKYTLHCKAKQIYCDVRIHSHEINLSETFINIFNKHWLSTAEHRLPLYISTEFSSVHLGTSCL